jgi:hypothetical protein
MSIVEVGAWGVKVKSDQEVRPSRMEIEAGVLADTAQATAAGET